MAADAPVTLVAIGPAPTIAEALRCEPGIAPRTHFVGMYGSFHWHHRTNLHLSMKPGAIAEFNVVQNLPAAQIIFRAPWRSMTITPLDTCGWAVLDGDRYTRLRDADDPLLRAVMTNYRIWSPKNAESDPETHTSVLYDTVAIHLAHSTKFLAMQRLPVLVDDEGYTRVDPAGRVVHVAMEWLDLPGYLDHLTARLLGG
jgi:inosine-uridine nucleoside N-ribohydrolase